MARAFLERIQERGWPVRRVALFGDAAGRSPHSNTGESDYEIILEVLAGQIDVDWNVLSRNPPIKDTVNAVRTALVNANGIVSLWVDPRCRRLIDDMGHAPWPHDLKEFHALAALRYWAFARYGHVSQADDYATGHSILPAFGSPTTRSGRLA
jgi:hypothetical protein